jgi:hypothetical protein
MGGWKTWLAAIGSIVWGVGGYLSGAHELDAAAAFVSGGLAMIGLGHKLDKLAQA